MIKKLSQVQEKYLSLPYPALTLSESWMKYRNFGTLKRHDLAFVKSSNVFISINRNDCQPLEYYACANQGLENHPGQLRDQPGQHSYLLVCHESIQFCTNIKDGIQMLQYVKNFSTDNTNILQFFDFCDTIMTSIIIFDWILNVRNYGKAFPMSSVPGEPTYNLCAVKIRQNSSIR